MQDRRDLSLLDFCREYITGWWGRATYIALGTILGAMIIAIPCYINTRDEAISNNGARKFYQELLYSNGLNKPDRALAQTLAAADDIEPYPQSFNQVGQIIISEAASGRRFPGHLLSDDGSNSFRWLVLQLLWSLVSLFGATAFMRRAISHGEDIGGFPDRMWTYFVGMAFFPAAIGLSFGWLIQRFKCFRAKPKAVHEILQDRQKEVGGRQAWKEMLAGNNWCIWHNHLVLLEKRESDIQKALRNKEAWIVRQQGDLARTRRELKASRSAEPSREDIGALAEADADYDRLLALPGFRGATVTPKAITAKIGPVKVMVCGNLYDLGDYSFVIDRLTHKLSLKVMRYTGLFGNIHPYASTPWEKLLGIDISFCFGSRDQSICNLIQARRYLAAIALVIEALHHINPGNENLVIGYYPIIAKQRPA